MQELSPDCSKPFGPTTSHTYRGAQEIARGRLVILGCTSCGAGDDSDALRATLWAYHIATGKWCVAVRRPTVIGLRAVSSAAGAVLMDDACDRLRLFENDTVSACDDPSRWARIEPRPRYASQIVYDGRNDVFYLFGGNPGGSSSNRVRLNDFWSLRLVTWDAAAVQRHAIYLLRREQFRELAAGDKAAALRFLQTSVSDVVDHADPSALAEFRALPATLFRDGAASDWPRNVQQERSRLFEQLLDLFPSEMRQPPGDLADYLDP